jgi:hypothetical protein
LPRFAQTILPQAGYRLPEPLEVAPGQIVMITVAGLNISTPLAPTVFCAGNRTRRIPRKHPSAKVHTEDRPVLRDQTACVLGERAKLHLCAHEFHS